MSKIDYCLNCGGAIFEEGIPYMYAGKVCYCPKAPEHKFQRPASKEKKCPPHQWDQSGERCTKCGDKDWMT